MANNRLILIASSDGDEVTRVTIGKRMGYRDWYPPNEVNPALLDFFDKIDKQDAEVEIHLRLILEVYDESFEDGFLLK